MFRITKVDIRWGIKVYFLGISFSFLAIFLSHTYPDYWVPIVYANSGFIIYLILLTARKIEWKK
jgi:hypothetical protein